MTCTLMVVIFCVFDRNFCETTNESTNKREQFAEQIKTKNMIEYPNTTGHIQAKLAFRLVVTLHKGRIVHESISFVSSAILIFSHNVNIEAHDSL